MREWATETENPELSRFYGIVIQMYSRDHARRHAPHVHAIYAENTASYNFAGEVLDGELPARAHKIVKAWIKQHKMELTEAWANLGAGKPTKQIPPMK